MLLTVKEYAEASGYSVAHVRRLIKDSELKAELTVNDNGYRRHYVIDSRQLTVVTKGKRYHKPAGQKKPWWKHKSFLRRQKPKKPKSELEKVLAECAEYNRKHGTALSYGQYVSMTEVEK